MPRAYSAAYKSTLARTDAPEAPLHLLEISHPGLTEPVRVVNDTEDVTSNNSLFVACPFSIVLPDDLENQLPRARLSIDNVGRDLVYWIETSGGGEGASVRVMQIMRSAPDVIEFDVTLALNNVRVTMTEISGDLGFENFFARPAIALQYRPDTAPGVF